MLVEKSALSSVRRQIEVAEAWKQVNHFNLLAKNAATPQEKRQHYAAKGEAVSKLIELEAVEIQTDGNSMSVVDQVRGWRVHIHWEQLTLKAQELIRQEAFA